MKKLLSLLIAITLLLSAASFYSCSDGMKLYTSGNGETKIVCTVFPIFDIARNVAGETATVSLLQDNGTDPHSYTPTAAALKAVNEADIFIYIGGPSDSEWVSEMIKSSENANLKAIKLSDYMDELIVPETACTWDEHDHEHEHSDAYDEHIWSSLENAIKIANAICAALCEKTPESTDSYTASCIAYTEKLSALSAEYKEAFENALATQLVFADRFPFVYLLHDYKFSYLAAFGGCSTETDSSYETLDIICEAVKSGSVSAVLTIEGSDKKLAESVSKQTGCGILTVNSLQSVNRAQIDGGLTYIDTMEKNLEIFREVLNSK